MAKDQWKMPDWMEEYRELIINTGGNQIEELMSSDTNPWVNLPRSTIEACVKSQIGLLEILKREGKLK